MEPFARVPGRSDSSARRGEIDAAVGKRRHATRRANLGTLTGYRIGLDVGNGNVGWCILFEDGPRPCFLTAQDISQHNRDLPRDATRTQLPDLDSFVPLGTHKFQAREPGEKVETSFSKKRAEAGSARKLLDARQRRRLHVRRALVDAGLLPAEGQPMCGDIKTKADKLRVKLLKPDFPAHPHDLGRALLNTLKRRGYMDPVKRTGKDEESGFGKRIETAYRDALAHYGCETVGEFLERCAADAKQDGERFRKRHNSLDWQRKNKNKKPKDPAAARSYETFRFLTPTYNLIWEEACKLREQQQAHVAIDSEIWNAIESAAEFRRPLKAKTPGFCRFFKRKRRRCVRALPSFQRFRILQQVTHLRDMQGQRLSRPNFEKAIQILESTDRITVLELSKRLGIGRLELKEQDDERAKRTLVGATTDQALTAALGPAWIAIEEIERRDDWVMRLLKRHWTDHSSGKTADWTPNDTEDLKRDVVATFGKTLEEVDALVGAQLAKDDRFANLSADAARILADCYAEGLADEEHHKALEAAGAPKEEMLLFDELPYYGQVMPEEVVPADGFAPPERTCAEELEHGRAANPDVHVVLNRIRKVVNAIIEMMGGILPTRCIVEVARDALSEEAANAYSKKAKAREVLREAIKTEIDRMCKDLGRKAPRGPGLDRLVDRWKAAVRQGWRDYDGSTITPSNLIDGSEYQLDHVFPAAFGDYRENNMFVTRFNRQKGRRKPWEAFHEDPAFKPALTAFASFGLQQRTNVLTWALQDKAKKLDAKRRDKLEAALERAKAEIGRLGDSATPNPLVAKALEQSLTGRIDALVAGSMDEEEETGGKRATRPFGPGEQAALFSRFGPPPDGAQPERDFAARDVANIGWSTKATVRLLRHLGATVVPIKPWAVRALRCMFNIDKHRADLRNHAVDAFLIAHFDDKIMCPAFAKLRHEWPYEALYDPRALEDALDRFGGGPEVFARLKPNLDRLNAVLPQIATAHRADNRWNPGDAAGGSFGSLGGENVYAFRPMRAEREKLTNIVRQARKWPAHGPIMTRDELLMLLRTEPYDESGFRLHAELRKAIELRYRKHDGEKPSPLKMKTSLHLPEQPGAFIDAAGKFAIAAPSQLTKRQVVPIADFSKMNARERAELFSTGCTIYRRGDTVIDEQRAYAVTGLKAKGELMLYPVDVADKETKDLHRPTVPVSNKKLFPFKFSSDVLGRRLHRFRKDSGGLKPVPYRLFGE